MVAGAQEAGSRPHRVLGNGVEPVSPGQRHRQLEETLEGPSESCSHLTPQPPSSFSPLHLETAMITVFLCLLPEYSMYIRANMFPGICLFFFQYRWWQQSHCFAPCSFHFTASVGNGSLSVQTELPVLFHSGRVFPGTAHPSDPQVGSPRLGPQSVSHGAEAGCGGWL